jgi:hypothetical protein
MGLITVNSPDALASVTALFQFLSTPSGQNVVEDFRKLNKDVIGWIGDLIGVIHKHHQNEIPERSPEVIIPIKEVQASSNTTAPDLPKLG